MIRGLRHLLGGAQGGAIVGRLLRGLLAGNHHQAVFDALLAQLRDALTAREAVLRDVVEDRVREQGGRLVGWAIGRSVASRVLAALGAELDRAGLDESGLREAFDTWIRAEIARLEHDPARAAALGLAIRNALSRQPAARAWFADIWNRFAAMVAADAADAQGGMATILRSTIRDAAARLRSDPASGQPIAAALDAALSAVLPDLQTELAAFITRVIAGWDETALVQRLERSVGAELQYIRINGTVLGMLAGGVLYMVTRMIGAE